jgi:integrase
MLIYSKQEGWIQDNPFDRGGLISKADEARRKRVLSFDEEQRLLDACTDKRSHIKTLLVCAIDTGLRRGELLSLRWADADLVNRIISVRALNTKTLTARTVPISDRLAIELERLREDATDDSHLFTVVDIRKAFYNSCKTAGLSGLRFHDLRATTASRLIGAGLPLEEVAKILGHTVLNTTYQHYTRINSETLDRAREALNKLNGPNPIREGQGDSSGYVN